MRKKRGNNNKNVTSALTHNIIYYWIVTLFVLNVIYKLFSTFFWSYYRSSLSPRDNDKLDFFYELSLVTYQLTVNFLIFIAFQYLFYHQGLKMLKKDPYYAKSLSLLAWKTVNLEDTHVSRSQ